MQQEMFDASPSPPPKGEGPLTCFGAEVDALARKCGNWPADAVVYQVEAINDTQAMLTGEVPIGVRKNDATRPQFAPKKAKVRVYQVVILIADWHALFDKSNGTDKAPSE